MRHTLNRAERARLTRLIVTDPINGCWIWGGATNSNGYGWAQKTPGSGYRVVHRIMWEDRYDTPVPEGHQLDHLCRNRRCCNPDHLEPVTASTNTYRQDHANRRKTACPRGHEFTPENTINTSRGRRVCRICERARKGSVNRPESGRGGVEALENLHPAVGDTISGL